MLNMLHSWKMLSESKIMVSNQTLNIVRHYAKKKSIKPPTHVFGMDGRYASALYSAAVKLKQLEVVEKDVINIQTALKGGAKLKNILEDPTVQGNIKSDAIKEVTSQAKLSDPCKNLLALLAENGRLNRLDQVLHAFSTIMAGHRGELRCEITTATPMDDDTKKQLEAVLKAFAKKGENIILELKVDPAIIGGMIASIGDNYVDMSVASKIKKYADIITEHH